MNLKIKPATIGRTVLLLLALGNQALAAMGRSPLPIDDAQVSALISTLFTIGTALLAWWKNNSFTPAALAGDNAMAQAKQERSNVQQ